MLTGKDVHGALLFAETHFTAEWDELSTYQRCVYDTAATALNGTYMAPLQGRIGELEANFHAAVMLSRDEDRQKIVTLQRENAALRARIGELEQENVELEVEIAEDAIEIEAFKQKNGAQGPLTGNFIHNRYIDVYRQIVAKNPKTTLFCRFWTELDSDRIEAYNLIAAQINALFLAPLQGRIAELEQELEDDEEPMMPSAAGVAMASAMTEQAKRIDALEALVRDYQTLTLWLPLEAFARAEWGAERDVLHARAIQELLKGEK